MNIAPATQAAEPARVGNLAVAVARSWSNAVTASVGIVSVIGGPLRTGRHRSIEQVIRTTAPMHEGFAGGAFIDTTGKVIGIATAAAIRGLGVIIPAPIAWKTAAALLQHGRMRRGYIGIAAQPAADRALLVVDVRPGSPAEKGGVLAGDLLLTFDGQPVGGPEDLLQLLAEDRVGKEVDVRLLRGDTVIDVRVTVADRADRQ